MRSLREGPRRVARRSSFGRSVTAGFTIAVTIEETGIRAAVVSRSAAQRGSATHSSKGRPEHTTAARMPVSSMVTGMVKPAVTDRPNELPRATRRGPSRNDRMGNYLLGIVSRRAD